MYRSFLLPLSGSSEDLGVIVMLLLEGHLLVLGFQGSSHRRVRFHDLWILLPVVGTFWTWSKPEKTLSVRRNEAGGCWNINSTASHGAVALTTVAFAACMRTAACAGWYESRTYFGQVRERWRLRQRRGALRAEQREGQGEKERRNERAKLRARDREKPSTL